MILYSSHVISGTWDLLHPGSQTEAGFVGSPTHLPPLVFLLYADVSRSCFDLMFLKSLESKQVSPHVDRKVWISESPHYIQHHCSSSSSHAIPSRGPAGFFAGFFLTKDRVDISVVIHFSDIPTNNSSKSWQKSFQQSVCIGGGERGRETDWHKGMERKIRESFGVDTLLPLQMPLHS